MSTQYNQFQAGMAKQNEAYIDTKSKTANYNLFMLFSLVQFFQLTEILQINKKLITIDIILTLHTYKLQYNVKFKM